MKDPSVCACVCEPGKLRGINWWFPDETGLNVQEKGPTEATWIICHSAKWPVRTAAQAPVLTFRRREIRKPTRRKSKRSDGGSFPLFFCWGKFTKTRNDCKAGMHSLIRIIQSIRGRYLCRKCLLSVVFLSARLYFSVWKSEGQHTNRCILCLLGVYLT